MLRLVPPPLWALLFLGATYALSLVPPFAQWPMLQHKPTGFIVMGAALALLFTAMLQFRFANTQLLPTSPTNNSLVTSGVFALTRNPMYLAMTLFALGAAIWMGPTIMLLAPVLMFGVANWVFIPFEEAKMRRQFGESFDAYCGRVRRWL